jgi:hypothetical protein
MPEISFQVDAPDGSQLRGVADADALEWLAYKLRTADSRIQHPLVVMIGAEGVTPDQMKTILRLHNEFRVRVAARDAAEGP